MMRDPRSDGCCWLDCFTSSRAFPNNEVYLERLRLTGVSYQILLTWLLLANLYTYIWVTQASL